ncbi:hypothetical protein HMPREF9499_00735 [Enterococcus faecalis TX0012]|nr:hypothetical protein HMPREF9499_00735 [Enterococcus faecalis TX0012]
MSNEFLFPVAKVIVTWFVKNVTNFDCKNDTVFRPVSKWQLLHVRNFTILRIFKFIKKFFYIFLNLQRLRVFLFLWYNE